MKFSQYLDRITSKLSFNKTYTKEEIMEILYESFFNYPNKEYQLAKAWENMIDESNSNNFISVYSFLVMLFFGIFTGIFIGFIFGKVL